MKTLLMTTAILLAATSAQASCHNTRAHGIYRPSDTALGSCDLAVNRDTVEKAQPSTWPCYTHPETGVCEPAKFLVRRFRCLGEEGCEDDAASQATNVTRSRTTIRQTIYRR